LVIYIRFIL